MMKINVYKIPEEGLEVTANSKEDAWCERAIATGFPELEGTGETELSIIEGVDTLVVNGEAWVTIHSQCDRCLGNFSEELHVPIHQVFIPKGGERKQGIPTQQEIELTTEDLDCSFYEGETIDLEELLREQLALALPLQFLCKESCRGLCPQCGVNRNQTECACRLDTKASPFAVLKSR